MYNMDQFRMTRMCIQAGRMTRFKNPADSDECNNFAPIHIYPSFELIRAIDWYSPRAEVYLWLLLTYGNPGVLNVISNGLTPMCRAALNGLDNYVSHLLKRGAAIEVGGEVDTPLSLASGSGHTSIVKLLLDKGANIEARDEGSLTPLLFVIAMAPREYGNPSEPVDVVDMLIQHGADINAETKYGQTALFLASGRPTKDNANLLVKKGALLETKRDAAMRLSRKLHQTILKLFKSES